MPKKEDIMRSFLFLLFFIVYFAISPILWLIILIFRLFSRKLSDRIALAFVKFACRIGRLMAGTRVTVHGREYIPKDETVVYVLNHRSIFDIILTYPYIKSPTGVIAKKELVCIPFFSTWLYFANTLFLDRGDIRKGMKTMLQGIDKVKHGISMCIFPEGTRNKDQESKISLLEFHEASFKLATKPNVPIIPVAIYNSADCFENHKPWIRSARVSITYGKPIHVDELPEENRKFLGKYTRELIQNMLNEEAREAGQ